MTQLHRSPVVWRSFVSGSRVHMRYASQYPQNKQIFIHPKAEHHTSFASLSKNPKAVPLGTVYSTTLAITPQNFQENPAFLDILHLVVAAKVQNDFLFIVEAGANANTFMPIYDFRHIPNYARIPEVDNIFGYVQVDGLGKIIPGTYESNSLYRLCNGDSGIIKLSDYLYEVVQAECEKSTK